MRLVAALSIGTLLALMAVGAKANEALWAKLKAGGQVVLMRHAVTTPGVGDPAGMRLDDCATQRNLTDEGRRHARRTGDAFRERGIVVERLLASPWCRCLETAQLAFGIDAEKVRFAGNLFGRPENQPRQLAELQAAGGQLEGQRQSGARVSWLHHRRVDRSVAGAGRDGHRDAAARRNIRASPAG